MFKTILLDILDYIRNQVYNDKCTDEEMKSFYDSITEGIKIDATIGDIANHYGQSESNVRNVIARTYVGKPKRRVYYNFMKFIRCVPASWHKRKEQHVST